VFAPAGREKRLLETLGLGSLLLEVAFDGIVAVSERRNELAGGFLHMYDFGVLLAVIGAVLNIHLQSLQDIGRSIPFPLDLGLHGLEVIDQTVGMSTVRPGLIGVEPVEAPLELPHRCRRFLDEIRDALVAAVESGEGISRGLGVLGFELRVLGFQGGDPGAKLLLCGGHGVVVSDALCDTISWTNYEDYRRFYVLCIWKVLCKTRACVVLVEGFERVLS